MGPKQPVAGPSRIKASSSSVAPPPSAVSSFSRSNDLYACVQPVLGAADKLSVWDITSDRLISEWEVEGASKVTTLCWSTISSGQSRKKRRKSGEPATSSEEIVLLTTASGKLYAFSPKRGEITRRIDVEEVTASCSCDYGSFLITSKEILHLDRNLEKISARFTLPSSLGRISSSTVLSSSKHDTIHLLIASTSVTCLHLKLDSSSISHTSSPLPVSTAPVQSLTSLSQTSEGISFLVTSQDDRTVSQYTLSTPTSTPKLTYRYASPTLSPAHSLSLSSNLLSVSHLSGEVSLFPVPSKLDFTRPQSDSKPSTVKIVEGKEDRLVRLCGAVFADDDGTPGSLLCGRMVGGGKVKWTKAQYELPEGGVRSETVVKAESHDLVSKTDQKALPTQRFTAPPPLEVSTTQDTDPSSTLPADVDMADMTLGERLLALPSGDTSNEPETAAQPTMNGPVNAASLTRLLVQALHTSDPALLSLCLSHRDPVLIQNTIRKMPTQLALPLLKACVERLGQGKNSQKRGGGRGAGQNEQQGRGTVEWVKGVLVERGSLLMTMPSLPAQLATLSSLLTDRMTLYQPLLSLSGRLDLALAQISMRRMAAEQASQAGKNEVLHYVEGESGDESDEDVHVEVGDGDGEVEDIDMRVNGDLSSDESEDDDPLASGSEDGFIDDEAEDSSDGSEGESEED